MSEELKFEEWHAEALKEYVIGPLYKAYLKEAWNHQQAIIDQLQREKDAAIREQIELSKDKDTLMSHCDLLREENASLVKLKEDLILKLYARGGISQSRACELIGISRQEFIELLNSTGIGAIQTTLQELKQESKD